MDEVDRKINDRILITESWEYFMKVSSQFDIRIPSSFKPANQLRLVIEQLKKEDDIKKVCVSSEISLRLIDEITSKELVKVRPEKNSKCF